MEIEQWPIDRFIPYARNPRKNDEQVQRMVSSIKEFGFVIPVLAQSDGAVIDGHLRLKAAILMKLATVPVILADELSEAQVKAFRILANRSVAWAEWDKELLRVDMEELKGLDFDLELTGFDLGEIDDLVSGSNVDGTFPFGDEAIPDKLPPPDIQGEDSRSGRFILTFQNESEKEFWLLLIGIDGKKVIYSPGDLQ